MHHRIAPFLLGASALALGACSSLSTTTSQATSALDTAQCTYLANRATIEACEQAFHACVAQSGADLAACRATFEACVPAPPDGGVSGDLDGPGHHGGGMRFGGHGGRGPGPACDGGLGGPGEARGDRDGDGLGPDGGFGRGPARALPDSAAVAACHEALATCLAANPNDITCFETEHSCERAAFAAAFAALCQDVQPCTSSDPGCAELNERCREGVDGRPGAYDGGTCQ